MCSRSRARRARPSGCLTTGPRQLLAARPIDNVPEGIAHGWMEGVLAELDHLTPQLDAVADARAERLLSAHLRARAGSSREAQSSRRGLTVTAQHPVDILSVQLLMPVAGGAR